MVNYVNNPLVFLFNEMESKTGYTFSQFNVNETPNTIYHSQPRMQQYINKQNNSTNQIYKYLYDPSLAFSFRFHQRIARIKYNDRKLPWITIIFNVGEKTPYTGVLSHKHSHHEKTDTSFYNLDLRRSKVPVDMVFISNSMDYLMSFNGRLNYWFDRITGYQYEQTIQYSNSLIVDYTLSAQVINIIPKDLNKLDTERRGSLATVGYSFDLVYYEFNELPVEGNILRNIDLLIKTLGTTEALSYEFI